MRLPSFFVLVAFLVSMSTPALADESATPDFSGQWQLNAGASEDPAKIMQKAMRSAGRSGNGGGRGGGMSGGRGGGMGGGPGGGIPGGRGDSGGTGIESRNRPDGSRMAADMRRAMSRLEIFHSGNVLNITDGRDISQLMEIGGKQTPVWTEHGKVQATAVWRDGALLVSVDSGREGVAMHTRSFQLSDDGSQLFVVEERPLPHTDRTIRIRLVYDWGPKGHPEALQGSE